MPTVNPIEFVIRLLVIFIAIAIHEYAHAKLADAAGDPTPGSYGRVTLNPFAHFDPLGSIFIIVSSLIGFGIGWGKPVPMDPRKMRNPKWDHFWAVLGGPLSNLLQAVVFAIVLRAALIVAPSVLIGPEGSTLLFLFLLYGVIINVSLFVFNLIPLGPLDGMWIVGTFLPERLKWGWTRWNLTVGQFVFLILIFLPGVLGSLIGPVRRTIAGLLGVPL